MKDKAAGPSIDQRLEESNVTFIPLATQFAFRTDLGDEVTSAIKEDVLKIMGDPDSTPHDNNLAGRIYEGDQVQIREDQFTENLQLLKKIIENISEGYVEKFFSMAYSNTRRFTGKVELFDIWIVNQQPNDYNPLHCHHTRSTAGLSGVFYLECPERIWKLEKGYQEGGVEGWLQIIFDRQISPDSANFITQGNLIVPPKPGNFILFPSGMGHQVNSFRGEGRRICLAFNVDVWYLEPS